jgi:hypothetical protein
MRKSLIVAALLLASPVLAGEKPSYILKGTQVLFNECGHAKDMLKDIYKIHFVGNTPVVNYTEWQLEYQSDTSFLIEYKAAPDAYTQLDLVYFKDINMGYLTLTETTEYRDVCFDRIQLIEK